MMWIDSGDVTNKKIQKDVDEFFLRMKHVDLDTGGDNVQRSMQSIIL